MSCFGRTPGYSFFIGLIYIVSNKEISLTLQIIPFFQIIMDCFSLFFIFSICKKSFNNNKIALIASLLYALYPFVIVWTVIVYAETLSVFLLLLSISLVINSSNNFNYLIGGIIFGLSILTRIQLIVAAPVFEASATCLTGL